MRNASRPHNRTDCRHSRRAWIVATVLLLLPGRPAPGQAADDVGQLQSAPLLEDQINAALNLRSSTAIELSLQTVATDSPSVSIPIGGRMELVDLAPHSVRSETYRVTVQLADGSYAEFEPRPPRTYRGTIRGKEGSVVAASLLDDGLRARIILPDGAAYWVEPVGGAAADAGTMLHAVYRGEDVLPGGGHCAALDPPAEPDEILPQAGGGEAATGLFIAELAIDADYEYFHASGSVESTIDHIETIINAVNVQYERDVSIRHAITQIIVRTAEPDPYTATRAESLLLEFLNHWKTAQSHVARDVAQLFTGKNMDGVTIGIAYVGVICSASYGYSVVESNCGSCSSLACKSDLSAHELGHNWGAGHCGDEDGIYDCDPPCPDYTMNCYITCENRFSETLTIPEIVAYRNSRPCLDLGDELRRITVSAASNTVAEGGTLQFTAIADFQFGDDQDVTAESQWSVDRPAAAAIEPGGRLSAFDVDSNVCVTVAASYTAEGITRTNGMTILITDLETFFEVIGGSPPDGAIDARQPSRPDGSNPDGWRSFDLHFSGEVCLTSASDFAVTQAGGTKPAPAIAGFEQVGADTVRIYLSRIIEPGARTGVTHLPSGSGVSVAFLPGDVNADGLAGPVDILALIDNLNEHARPPCAIWQCDTDRNGICAPGDILRLIDLLNGADAYEPWLGRSLP